MSIWKIGLPNKLEKWDKKYYTWINAVFLPRSCRKKPLLQPTVEWIFYCWLCKIALSQPMFPFQNFIFGVCFGCEKKIWFYFIMIAWKYLRYNGYNTKSQLKQDKSNNRGVPALRQPDLKYTHIPASGLPWSGTPRPPSLSCFKWELV